MTPKRVMNPSFLILLIINNVVAFFDLAGMAKTFMWLVKNVRMVIGMFIPEKKGSLEVLRGGIVKINYVIPGSGKSGYFLLSSSQPPKLWERVSAILESDYQHVQSVLPKIEPPVVVDTEARTVEDDIQEIAEIEPPKFNYRDYPLTDVTERILELSGPGKDFFSSPLTPQNIDHHYHCLIFHYGRGLKIFQASDPIILP